MGAKHRRRTRDVPHPTGSRIRDLGDETNERRRKRHFGSLTDSGPAGRGTKRIDGASGSWPAQRGVDPVPPKRPPLCLIYEDLADVREPAAVFGMYPAALIPKILPWLKCDRREVLHVCSGGLPRGEGIRVDVRPEAQPDILADGRKLPLDAGSVAAVMLDPPYTEHYARDLYGTDYPRPSHLLREAARVVRPGGRIAFVHYITPNPPPACWCVKVFGLSTGFGFPMRAVTIYEREQDALFARASGRPSDAPEKDRP